MSTSRRVSRRSPAVALIAALAMAVLYSTPVAADTTTQSLPFSQDWTNTGLITAPGDDWSGVPGIIGYRGDTLAAAPGVDPQTVVADGSATPIDVNANQANPNTFNTGGVAEFDALANPVVALQGSGTADAPHLVIAIDTTGHADVNVAYNLRDVDGSADNAVQPVALQYRVGASGNFTNLPAGFVADASSGPSLATQVTPISVALPAEAGNQPLVQVRVITTDATGSDEWVGVDDISITAGIVDVAPSVSSTVPTNGATGVPVGTDITINFSEIVDVAAGAITVECPDGSLVASNPGANDVSSLVIDPASDLPQLTTCVIGIEASGVTDNDGTPDTLTGTTSFSFTTEGPPPPTPFIYQIQGAGHISPMEADPVADVPGIVTAKRSNGFYMQDSNGDANDATSDGIFVFTNAAPAVNVGDAVLVDGTVVEFRAAATSLTVTEIGSPVISVSSSGNPLPVARIIGTGGRVPPTTVIEDDATGDVETSGVFDPATDGIDFYESMEGMRVQVNNAVAVGPTSVFGSGAGQNREIAVLGDDGVNASVRTTRGGIVIQSTDFNPERIILNDAIDGPDLPSVHVADTFPGAIVGVIDYSFGNFKLEVTTLPAAVSGGLTRESATPAAADQLAVGTFNVENLDPGDGSFSTLAGLIVNNLQSPDILAIEEVQDDNGPFNDATVDATTTYNTLIAAITSAGGPAYEFRQINPVDDQDGGEPGGNIRQGFLFRTDRGLDFVDRPGGTSTGATAVVNNAGTPELQWSPGRIDPTNAAFNASRKPLVGEFTFNGHTLFVIANHFNSKGGDNPLYGRFQPPVRSSEVQRALQAQIVNDFVDAILAVDSDANVIVAGDINDFEFSNTMTILKGGVLHALVDSLPQSERYSYVFEGNSQTLDHILVSNNLFNTTEFEFDVVHINSEFADQASDHEPSVARFSMAAPGPDIEFIKTIGTATRNVNPNASISVPVPPAGVAAGHSIIVALKAGANTVTASCSDSQGNAYSQDVAAGGGGSNRASIHSAHDVTALVLGDWITCTYASFSGATAISITEFSGLAATSTLDATAGAVGTNGAPNSGLTAPTSQPDELVFGYVQSVAWVPALSGSNPAETYAAAPNAFPYTEIGTNVGGNVRPAYRIVTTTGQYQANGTGGGTGGWRALVATYRAAPAATGSLFVTKVLPNDNGSTASCDDFVFQVDGGPDIPFEADCTNELTVVAGTHTVTETEQSGFTTSYLDCDPVTVPNGGSATCTITNDDQPESDIEFVKTIGTATRNVNPNASISVPVPPAGVAAGHSIIVALKAGSSTAAASCSDSKGNAYSQDVAAGGGGSNRASIHSAHDVTALVLGDWITCTYASFSGATAISITEFSGLAATSTLDATAGAVGTNGAPNSGLTAPTSQPDELVFGYVQSVAWVPALSGSNPAETYAAAPNAFPYTEIGTNAGGNVRPAYRIVTTTGQYQANGTGGGTGGWRALVATYRAAP